MKPGIATPSVPPAVTLDCAVRELRGEPEYFGVVLRAGTGGRDRRDRRKLHRSALDALADEWITARQSGQLDRAGALSLGGRLCKRALGWSLLAREALEADTARLRLRLGRAVPELPWEFLAGHGEFLALRAGIEIVRSALRRREVQTNEPAKPWRVLIACAAEDGQEAGMRQELQCILDAARMGGAFKVKVQAAARLEDLERRLARAERAGRPFHLLHLAAHGTRDGGIILEDPASDGRVVTADNLAEALRASTRLWAVVTTACWGGSGAGIAATLARRGVLEVVGLAADAFAHEALAFSRAFYQNLGRDSIAGAVAAGRRALLVDSRPWSAAWSQVIHFSNAGALPTRQEESHPLREPEREERTRPGPPYIGRVGILGNVDTGGGDIAIRDLYKNHERQSR